MIARRTLGRTGLLISELSLGTVELGLDYGIPSTGEQLKPDEQRAAEVLHEALDLGINLLDTARAYGDAEEIIGRVLKSRRNEFLLLSKVGACTGRPEEVRRSVEASLAALQTDRIDVMMIHCGAEAQPDEETAVELMKCRDAGIIRFIGASVYGEAAALTAIDSEWCDCLEVAYSLLDRRPERSVFTRAAERQVGVLARSVLLKGALSSRVRQLPFTFLPLAECVEQMLAATEIGIEELPELAYRYVLTHQPPHSVLVGTSRIPELQACASYAEKGPLAAEMVACICGVTMPEERWLNPGYWPTGQS